MPAYYTVVQYVPDAIANERINIGVIVVGEGETYSSFLRNWDRVVRFAQRDDIAAVRDFAEWVTNASLDPADTNLPPQLPGLTVPLRLDESALRRMASEWSTTIQLMPLQPSLEAPEALLASSAATFLREPTSQRIRFRDRRDAAQMGVRAVRKAVEHRVGKQASRQFVRSQYELGGKVMPRLKVDLAVTNSRLHIASRALSFETYDMSELDQQARDAVYILEDVGALLSERQSQPVDLVMLALPPKAELQGFQRARQRFQETVEACQRINARVVLEAETRRWAEDIAELIETEIVPQEQSAAWG